MLLQIPQTIKSNVARATNSITVNQSNSQQRHRLIIRIALLYQVLPHVCALNQYVTCHGKESCEHFSQTHLTRPTEGKMTHSRVTFQHQRVRMSCAKACKSIKLSDCFGETNIRHNKPNSSGLIIIELSEWHLVTESPIYIFPQHTTHLKLFLTSMCLSHPHTHCWFQRKTCLLKDIKAMNSSGWPSGGSNLMHCLYLGVSRKIDSPSQRRSICLTHYIAI